MDSAFPFSIILEFHSWYLLLSYLQNRWSLILYQQNYLWQTIYTVWTHNDHGLNWFLYSKSSVHLIVALFLTLLWMADGLQRCFCLHWVVGSLQITCCDECLRCTRGTMARYSHGYMVMGLDIVGWGVLSLLPPLPGDLGFSCYQVESRRSRKQWEIEAAVISEEQHRLIIMFGRNLWLQIAIIKQNGLW